MSAQINDGGPAFPDDNSQVGMSLRDYFAGQALAGISANPREDYSGTTRDDKANESYRQADAMLAARNLNK